MLQRRAQVVKGSTEGRVPTRISTWQKSPHAELFPEVTSFAKY